MIKFFTPPKSYIKYKTQFQWGIALLLAITTYFYTLVVDAYFAYILTSWIIFGLLGLSLSVIWGQGGILSLGQTCFYGLGAYVSGVVTINLSFLTGNTIVWSLPTGIIVGMASSALVGLLIFYNRMGELQTTILTYTITLILWTLSISFNTTIGKATVGGDNGMTNIPGMILSFGKEVQAVDQNTMLFTVIIISVIVLFITRLIVKSPFGTVINCIRQDKVKAELLGYDIRKYQLLLFIYAGGIAGLAGSLFAMWANYLNPSIFSIQEALLVPIYVLVGGLGSLIGSFVGALSIGGLSFWLGGGAIGGQTTLIMGLLLIVLVIFFKEGIMGWLINMSESIKTKNEKNIDNKQNINTNKIGVNLDWFKQNYLTEKILKCSFKTKNLSKSFGGITPVNNVSLTYDIGKVHCIIGPNGAGKSTYLKLCVGIKPYQNDTGEIFINDIEISKSQPFIRTKLGLGIKNQKAQVFPDLTVVDNLWIAAYSKQRNSKTADLMSKNIMQMLGMHNIATKLAKELSHGWQQWLDIGMVISQQPDIILLDEPAAGMTKEERKQLSALIKILATKRIVILVDHDMDFLRSLDAEITVLHQGKIFAQGDIDTLHANDDVLDIYLGRRQNV